MKYILIWWHKRKVRNARLKINALLRSYPCGIDMINVITGGEYNRLANECNKHIRWLKANDPKYPK